VDVTASVSSLTSAVSPGDGYTYTAATSSTAPDPCQASANNKYICAIYEALLNRSADPGGLLGYEAVLSSGGTGVDVAASVLASQEYRTDLVQQWFNSFLGRAADPAGLNTFLGLLNQGVKDQTIMGAILGSPEFYSRAGGTPSGFITALYGTVLQRSPDAAGQAGWQSALATHSRTQVAEAFLGSAESRTLVVETWFKSYLHRAADAGGLNTFVSALGGGATYESLIAQILGGPEFRTAAS